MRGTGARLSPLEACGSPRDTIKTPTDLYAAVLGFTFDQLLCQPGISIAVTSRDDSRLTIARVIVLPIRAGGN